VSFQIHSLSPDQFAPLFRQSNETLSGVKALKMTVDAHPGYPCRVSLVDAEIGETVLLVNYQHQPAHSPFQSAHAIFVREHAEQAFPEPGTIPGLFLKRLISVRAFNEQHSIINADVVDGARLHDVIPAMMNDPDVGYLHLHNAKLGCYLGRVTRS